MRLPAIQGDTTITLSYTEGVPSAIALTPVVHGFGAIPTDTTSATQAIRLSNVLGRDVSPSVVSLTAGDASDFAITSENCVGRTLHELDSCTVTVRFEPTSYGPRSATLTIADDGPGSPRRVALTGVGDDVTDPTIDISFPIDGQERDQGHRPGGGLRVRRRAGRVGARILRRRRRRR